MEKPFLDNQIAQRERVVRTKSLQVFSNIFLSSKPLASLDTLCKVSLPSHLQKFGINKHFFSLNFGAASGLLMNLRLTSGIFEGRPFFAGGGEVNPSKSEDGIFISNTPCRQTRWYLRDNLSWSDKYFS